MVARRDLLRRDDSARSIMARKYLGVKKMGNIESRQRLGRKWSEWGQCGVSYIYRQISQVGTAVQNLGRPSRPNGYNGTAVWLTGRPSYILGRPSGIFFFCRKEYQDLFHQHLCMQCHDMSPIMLFQLIISKGLTDVLLLLPLCLAVPTSAVSDLP